MKQLLTSFVRYDLWANEKILQVILSLSEEQQKHYIASSFPSVEKTCLHIWDASSIWWQRVQLHEQIVVPSLSFHPSMKDIANGLVHQNKQWIDWIVDQDEKTLESDFSYKSSKGDPYRQPLQDIVLHLSNHGTYHRGQLVTMLRQLGLEKIPQVDYILFARSVL